MSSLTDYLKHWCGIMFCMCLAGRLGAQDGQIKKDAVSLKGSLGASANFYSSNESDSFKTRVPYTMNLYGNAVVRYKDLSVPVSFILNRYGDDRSSTFAQYGLSPTYKWAKLHLGYRYIPFSPLTFEGQSFRGAGVELKPGWLRFAAFAGKLNKVVREDTSREHFTVPRYSRTAYGVKLGIGNVNNYFDLMYFHAKDDSNSVSISDSITKNAIRPQENTVLGASFRLRFWKKLSFTGDLAVSGLTYDLSFAGISPDSVGKNRQLAKLVSKLLPFNASTVPSYAGQSSLYLVTRHYSSSISYRRIEPDFKSLGTPYMLRDIELASWMNNISALKGRLGLTTTLSYQHNNLNKKLSSELRALVAAITANAMLSRRFSINMNYMGYDLDQKNGTVTLPANYLSRQKISQFGIFPSYNILRGDKLHYISGNLNLSILNDKNQSTAAFTNSNNISTALNYTISLIQKNINFSASALYNRYKQRQNNYRSYGGTIGSAVQLLKDKKLHLQGNIGYLINRYSVANSSGNNNITYSVNAAYHVKQHAFSLFANFVQTQYDPINDIIKRVIAHAVTTNNRAGGISYNYSF